MCLMCLHTNEGCGYLPCVGEKKTAQKMSEKEGDG